LTLPFELVVALRFLREGRFQTWLIVGGAGVGVAVVIFITALVNGLQANTIKRTLGTQAHIVLRPPEEVALPQRAAGADEALLPSVQARAQRLRSIDQWQTIAARLDGRAGIVAVSPIVSGPAFAVRGDANKSVAVQGVQPDRYTRVIRMDDKLVAGDFRVQPGEAVIGRDLATDLGIGVGDRFRLVTGSGAAQVDDAYVVTGLVDLGIRDMNRRAVYLGLRTAQALFDLPGGASQIDLAVDDLFGAEGLAQSLARETGLTADSWMKTNEQLLAAINAQTITTRTIRVFVSIVVVLGIASVLVVWVVQKRREIGILRAMGASRGRIQRVFLLQGAMVALAGALIGSAIATVMIRIFGRIARNMDGTPLFALDIDPALYLWTVAGAILAGVLAAAAPARRAAHLDPAQAIRS
jgi:lipoprotein-releasing system permease protein